MSRKLLLLLWLVLPTNVIASDFFTIWPGHPEAPERPGPPRTPIDREWSVGLNMRGIAANTAAIEKISVRLPDGERTFVMRRIDLISGFELVGEDDFEIRPDTRDEEISYNWTGTAESEEMTIAVYQGVMSATITGSRGVYSLIRRDSLPVFQQIDVSRIPTLEPGGGGKPPRFGKQWHAPLSAIAPMPKLAIDSIDVLVVHTPAALTLAGSVADMNARVAESFLQIDEAMRTSGMSGVKVRNVLSGSDLSALVSYSEVPSHTCAGPEPISCKWVGHRVWLRTSSQVAALRDAHGADLVVLLIADEIGSVGIAYAQNTNCGVIDDYEESLGCDVGASYAPFAFAVVSLPHTTSYQVFTHELGHQFGMQHQTPLAGGVFPAYFWSYARTRSDGQIQTVVGGTNNPPLFRSLQFSNPNISFIGTSEPSGSGAEFNARTGACLAPAMSGFRTPGRLDTFYSDGFELRLIPIDGC